MKKYFILFFAEISIILIIIGSGYTCIDKINMVKGVTLYQTTASKILNISGKVQLANTHEYCAQGNGIVQYVFVNEGDYVQKGDTVMVTAETDNDIDITEIYKDTISNKDNDNSIWGDIIDENISIKTYKASVSGIIYNLNADINNVYIKGSTLFSISCDSNGYEIISNVSENNIMQLKKGQKVFIKVNAIPYSICGAVKEIGCFASQTGNALNRETTVKVTIAINNNYDELKRGYTAECKVITEKKDSVLLAPYSAIETDADGHSFVYVAKDNKYQKRNVICGEEYSEGIEIIDGLTKGNIVVYDISSIDETKDNIVGEVILNEQ